MDSRNTWAMKMELLKHPTIKFSVVSNTDNLLKGTGSKILKSKNISIYLLSSFYMVPLSTAHRINVHTQSF